MKTDIKTIIIAILGILVLVGPVGKILGWDNDGEHTKTKIITKTEIKVDTILKIIEKTIIKEPVNTHTTKTVMIPYNPSKTTQSDSTGNESEDLIPIEFPINEYVDTLDIDGATLIYDHLITGILERSMYQIKYPQETVTIQDSIFTTITKTKNRIYDFFLIGGYQVKPYPEYEIGADLVTKKFKIGIRTGYDPTFNQQTFKVESGIRLFGQ